MEPMGIHRVTPKSFRQLITNKVAITYCPWGQILMVLRLLEKSDIVQKETPLAKLQWEEGTVCSVQGICSVLEGLN